MAVDLSLIANFSLTVGGTTIQGMQGIREGDETPTTPFIVSVDGDAETMQHTLTTDTAVTVWDDDDDKPVDFDVAFFVADVNMFIQVIASATSFTVPVLAGVPFILAPKTDALTAKVLGAGTTTPMSGSAPSVTEVDSIVVQNNSGGTGHFWFFAID